MRGPKVEAWERRLDAVLREVDHLLEMRHGTRYPLHPSRLAYGQAAHPKYHGLFQVSSGFSVGIGSEHGPGYVVDIRLATLAHVPPAELESIEDEAADLIRSEIGRMFPERDLRVDRDGARYKIFGDLSLG